MKTVSRRGIKFLLFFSETQSYVLNFHGRVTQASVKNFQIVPDNDGTLFLPPLVLSPPDHVERRHTDQIRLTERDI